MKNTPLHDKHVALGAKIIPFAGYQMPVSYAGIVEEHNTVRNAVGMFDVSHMGEFIVKGKEALQLVQKVTSNDASKLEIGDVQYSCLPNATGGIIDDLLVYRLPEDKCAEGEQAFMLVVNASNIEKDWNWIAEHNQFDAKMTNISDQSALMAVQGPKATEALQSLTDIDLAGMKYYTFQKGTFAGVENVLVSATGYTGAGGFEIYVENSDAPKIWDAIMEAGQPQGIQAIGLGARDTLRLEMGFCLYGNDIDDTTSPLEAGLGWITKLKQDADFVAKDILIQQKANGLDKKLVGFEVLNKRPARQGYPIVNAEGEVIGRVTSGTKSPTLGKCVGMGYVAKAYSKKETAIYIDIRGKHIEAKVTRPPFIKG
ncbi:MAG: glycine cleavage system aminomethyltransferase GcvT [Aureispira sp.]|nr:glycine cleavage system aminomethyltransferase GcvT [Aureispira sp.]